MIKIKVYQFVIYGVLFPLSVFLTSCSKGWLEEKPDKRMVIPETLDDFQGMLDNPSMFQQYPVLGEVSSDLHYISDVMYQSTEKGSTSDAYIWSYTTRHESVSDWNQSYEKVLWDNIILDGLGKIEPGNPSDTERWKSVKGQALFNRARVFFELLHVYAPQYDKNTSKSDLGIVIRLNTDLSVPSKRSTVEETYKKIIQDLEEALTLLPPQQSILTRPSQLSTIFLLSRVYLCMGEYEKSLAYIKDCLSIKSTLINYNSLPANGNYIGRYNPEVILHSNFTNAFLISGLIDRSLFDLYPENDLRKGLFFRENPTDGAIVFIGNYDSYSFNNFNGFATDEAYLIRAECNARLNHVQEAMVDLNLLLKSRWSDTVDYTDRTASTQKEALQQILLERKKELILRGVRWMDLRRLNKDPQFAEVVTRTVEGNVYTLDPNSYKYTFPIPDDVIEQTSLEQNKGWKK
ncbi:RagB/SusD family nutrient uptake outer membrane protein [Chitinophaga barathri]|uniref:RagB/SusD family nutrient uptake outer membrane protein n=1 Tax=Chitinophaga barathri TaxID=1647451 RepID=A0A3N4MGH3_9BACT|nr:RagB/SusD family nutrient uptake outer membrane protein [Chitinophaga barathri]RPD41116.1 RagB/SusD family nutrient uptake outer membrane protein [Chitinophaga barathri]